MNETAILFTMYTNLTSAELTAIKLSLQSTIESLESDTSTSGAIKGFASFISESAKQALEKLRPIAESGEGVQVITGGRKRKDPEVKTPRAQTGTSTVVVPGAKGNSATRKSA